MNFKRKLLFILISLIIIPLNAFAYTKYLIPGGDNIGIKVFSDGVYVVGFYKVDGREIAKDAGLLLGDRIVSVNDYNVTNVNSLLENVHSNSETVSVKYGFMRDDKLLFTTVNLKKDENGTYKTGIYVKDSITGIGTLTYIDPKTNTYGALGHEILESNTGIDFVISSGNIFESEITSITKGEYGYPGEKNAKLHMNKVLGNVKYNLETGVFGNLEIDINNEELLPVGSLEEVKIGKAEMITVLEGNKKEKFDIEILSIDKKNETKNFLIKVSDEELIKKTGGIVKGMSGSPIIQDGKIVGAVTHTIVDNPEKGYGISIMKMLEEKE